MNLFLSSISTLNPMSSSCSLLAMQLGYPKNIQPNFLKWTQIRPNTNYLHTSFENKLVGPAPTLTPQTQITEIFKQNNASQLVKDELLEKFRGKGEEIFKKHARSDSEQEIIERLSNVEKKLDLIFNALKVIQTK